MSTWSEWREWHGGEQPVKWGAFIEYEMRAYGEAESSAPEKLRWAHNGGSTDIIRYRVKLKDQPPANKYARTIKGTQLDVYDVLAAYQVICPALQHLIKKALVCGNRGHKDQAEDLQDIVDSALRARELGR